MKKFIIPFLIIVFVFLVFNFSSAQLLNGEALNLLGKSSQTIKEAGGFGDVKVGNVVASVVQAVLGLLAVIFLILMVFSGFKWMTASGNEDQVKKAVETIKAALIGLIIVLAAYAITYYIFTYLPFSRAQVSGRGTTVSSPQYH